MLAGQDKEARELINYNSQAIWKSGATTLVTSCRFVIKYSKRLSEYRSITSYPVHKKTYP